MKYEKPKNLRNITLIEKIIYVKNVITVIVRAVYLFGFSKIPGSKVLMDCFAFMLDVLQQLSDHDLEKLVQDYFWPKSRSN